MTKRRKRPETYEHEMADGRKVRVTVPDATDEDVLFDAIRDTFSPQATAVIAAYLDAVTTNNADVDRQVQWFADRLIERVGGRAAYNRLCDEAGL